MLILLLNDNFLELIHCSLLFFFVASVASVAVAAEAV